jgi:class 3 adenylate cyclase
LGGQCGAALRAVAQTASPKKSDQTEIRPAETSASENLEGERKTVTILFADIKRSMDLMEDLDPEEARAIVDPALKLMIGGGAPLWRLRRAIHWRRHPRPVRRTGRA